MLAIHAELEALARKLEGEAIPYALCGALALAIYGFPRSTYDIDLLALEGNASRIQAAAGALGYTLKAGPMQFAGGMVRITRISKPDADSEDVLSLDILTLVPELEEKISTRTAMLSGFRLQVASRESLILLKNLRGNHQDQADIKNLS